MLFLHADTILPKGWAAYIRDAVENRDTAGGAFRFSFSERSLKSSFVATMVNIRSRLFSLPYGDQAIFVRKKVFEKLGGVPDIPLMEDVEMVRRIGREGNLVILDASVVTSSRRWDNIGWVKTTIINQSLLYLYLLGVPPGKLVKLYRTFR